MTSETPVIEVQSWSDPLPPAAVAELANYLPSYIANQRWYRAKAQTIQQISISDVVAISDQDFVLVVEIHYPDDSTATYLLPVCVCIEDLSQGDQEVLGTLRLGDEQRIIIGALGHKDFRDSLLRAIAYKSQFSGRRGALVASHTTALGEICGSLPVLQSAVSRAEQSNTSIIFGERFILKLFRKIEPGINPDLEIGAFLTAKRFKHTPAVLGSLEYRGQEQYAAAILQQFVKNQGDAWQYTLKALSSFFERALALGNKPELFEHVNEHPLILMHQALSPEARGVLTTYLDSAELLGKRTAEMHVALAASVGNADFAPEPISVETRDRVYKAMLREADIAFETLRRKQASLRGDTAENVRELLRMQDRIASRFSEFREYPLTALAIRQHGDYHLGQVLFTGEDFMIIDFEGEPARPLAERRARGLAMRDVAGMVRSFEYAAFAALLDGIRGTPSGPEFRELLENWAAFWNVSITAAFLRAYFDEAGDAPFVPKSAAERRLLLDAFILQKACYEVTYELNNRPDWIRIPVRGMVTLARQSAS